MAGKLKNKNLLRVAIKTQLPLGDRERKEPVSFCTSLLRFFYYNNIIRMYPVHVFSDRGERHKVYN
jgi:hypothetical protein